MSEHVELGWEVTDSVTGFSGVAVGRCEYLTGCAQVLVQPRLTKDGVFVESRWMDEPRLAILKRSPAWTPQPSDKPGPDREAPRR